MARPASKQPTEVELEILKLLWRTGASELRAICDGLGRPVATTTVATMLKIMLEKNLVKREKGPKGYLWSARVSESSTTRGMLRHLIDRAFDGSADRLVARLLEDKGLSTDEVSEIRRLLDAHDGGER